MDQVLHASCPCSSLIENAEGINQVEVSFKTQRDLDLLNALLKLKLVLEDEEDMILAVAKSSCYFIHLVAHLSSPVCFFVASVGCTPIILGCLWEGGPHSMRSTLLAIDRT